MKYITKAGCNFEIDYGANFSRYTAKPENKTPYYRNFTTQLCLSIPELLSFFDVFGIDIIKPDSLVWNDEGEKLRYTAEYRCKGSIGDPGFTHRISRMNISVKDSGEGEFTFVVSDILLPWIVLDPRDGAAKPAPAEENFVSKLLGLFKK